MDNVNDDKLAEYSKKITDYVMYNEGSIFELSKLAKELNRNVNDDIVEMKQWYIETR